MNAVSPPRRAENILWFIAFIVTYAVGYRFGMSFGHQSPSPFWIPDAILLCALLKSPPRYWWAFVLATLPLRVATGLPVGFPLPFLLTSFVIDAARNLVEAFLLRRFLANPIRFSSVRDFVVFLGVAVIAAPAFFAFGGAGLFSARGREFWPSWEQWCFGTLVAQLVVTPFILYWVFDASWLRRRLDAQRIVEPGLLLAGLVMAGYFAATTHPGNAYYSEPRFFAPIPFMLWAAIRFGMRGAAGAVAVIAFFVVEAAITGSGPYSGRPGLQTASALQNFLTLRTLPLYLIAIVVEQRWSVERALRESEGRFRHMAENAPVLLWMSGRDKLCNFFNKGWLEFTGRTLAQEMGNGWTEGVHPDDIAQCAADYASAFDAREPFEIEYRLRRHDGEYRLVFDIGVPRYEPNGEFAGYIGSAIDITERERAEDMRRALVHTQRLAVMGELTAAIAHELRQPLSAILLDAQTTEKLAANENLSPDTVREIASGIRANAMRVDKVMSGLLGYMRKQDAQPKPIDINTVMQDLLQLIASDATRRSVQLRPELGRNLPLVLADRIQIEQVLINLAVNGMEAMESNDETARHLILRTVAIDNGHVQVTVSDCGTGIAPDKLPLLFDSFFTTRKEGMGLGLSIAKSIVMAHRGHIWAENNVSSGAAFHFTVPSSNDVQARAS